MWLSVRLYYRLSVRGLWCARGGCALPRRTVCDGLGMRTGTAKATCTCYSLVPSVILGKVVFHNNNARTERGSFGEAYQAQVAQHAPLAAHCSHSARQRASAKRRMTCAPPQNTALEATSGHAARETSMQDTLPEGTARPAQQLAPPLQPFFTAGVIVGGYPRRVIGRVSTPTTSGLECWRGTRRWPILRRRVDLSPE